MAKMTTTTTMATRTKQNWQKKIKLHISIWLPLFLYLSLPHTHRFKVVRCERIISFRINCLNFKLSFTQLLRWNFCTVQGGKRTLAFWIAFLSLCLSVSSYFVFMLLLLFHMYAFFSFNRLATFSTSSLFGLSTKVGFELVTLATIEMVVLIKLSCCVMHNNNGYNTRDFSALIFVFHLLPSLQQTTLLQQPFWF